MTANHLGLRHLVYRLHQAKNSASEDNYVTILWIL